MNASLRPRSAGRQVGLALAAVAVGVTSVGIASQPSATVEASCSGDDLTLAEANAEVDDWLDELTIPQSWYSVAYSSGVSDPNASSGSHTISMNSCVDPDILAHEFGHGVHWMALEDVVSVSQRDRLLEDLYRIAYETWSVNEGASYNGRRFVTADDDRCDRYLTHVEAPEWPDGNATTILADEVCNSDHPHFATSTYVGTDHDGEDVRAFGMEHVAHLIGAIAKDGVNGTYTKSTGDDFWLTIAWNIIWTAQANARIASVSTYESEYHPMPLEGSNAGYHRLKKWTAGGSETTVKVANANGAPSGSCVTAVVLSISASKTVDNGYVTAYQNGDSRPGTSHLNYKSGVNISNTVIIPMAGTTDYVRVYRKTTSNTIIVDQIGYFMKDDDTSCSGYNSGRRYVPLAIPQRVYNAGGRVAGTDYTVDVDSDPNVTAPTGATDVVVSISVSSASGNGWLEVGKTSGAISPTQTSLINFNPSGAFAGMGIVPMDTGNTIRFRLGGSQNPTGTVKVDVLGFMTTSSQGSATGKFVPMETQTRILDTRRSYDTASNFAPSGSYGVNGVINSGETRTLIAPRGEAIAANITLTDACGNVWVRARESDNFNTFEHSNVNTSSGANRANGSLISLRGEKYNGADIERHFDLYNGGANCTDAIVDLAGVFRT